MQPEIFKIFERLPRQGPGDSASTRRALAAFGVLPRDAHVIDFGCGAGAQTLELLACGAARVLAIDAHLPFLQRLRATAAERGLSERVTCVRGDFTRPPIAPMSADLIWAEGAIGAVPIEDALRVWRPLLRPGGGVALSHLTWLQPLTERAPEVVDFWAECGATLRTARENAAAARTAGFDVLDAFVLPVSAWWEDYYRPLAVRVDIARHHLGPDHAAGPTLDALEREIALYRDHADTYGYVFYVLRGST